jgi:two-component system response regulator AtoC
MSNRVTILVVDDEDESRAFLISFLEALGYAVEWVSGGTAALERLSRGPQPHAVLLDVVMADMDGIETLRRYRATGGTCPAVIVSALDQPDTIVQAMRLGAADYVTKPFNAEELKEILDRVTSAERPTVRTDPNEAPVEQPGRAQPGRTEPRTLGDSPAMQHIDELITRIADSDVPVLITGESGVGKDVVAREIHARSARNGKVFVKINCAALPSELLESELFGHEKGSFTGANRTKPGQFELADGGTLFLDEIGEMPPPLQAKLLQALQDGEFYRVGGQRKIRVDVRVIVATNRNLEKAMQEGTFREDLYYRLNVVHLHIPPLRDRPQDIPRLLHHFVEKYGRRYGWTAENLSPEIVTRFLAYDWPGNIRELENLVRRLMVLRDPAFVLAELRSRVKAEPAPAVPAPTAGAPTPAEETEYRADLKAIARKAAHAAEREAILTMLAHTAGNKREAAERLGISYKAILYKIREYGIGRPRAARRPLTPLAPSEPTPIDADVAIENDEDLELAIQGGGDIEPEDDVDVDVDVELETEVAEPAPGAPAASSGAQ